jgi:hypothetical protein
LKYSQLIQILRINPRNRAMTGFATEIAACINRGGSGKTARTPVPARQQPALARRKSGHRRARRFTPR